MAATRRYLKPERMARYSILRRVEKLTHREALEFSRMTKHVPPTGGKKQYPPALLSIVKQRRRMWSDFSREAVKEGWSKTRVQAEWKLKVGRTYERLSRVHKGNFFVKQDIHRKPLRTPRLNPWALYDAHYDDLPEDQQWDTPRSSRVALGTQASLRALNRYKVRDIKGNIKFFADKIRETGDPTGEYRWQLDGLRFQLKTGEY